MWQPPRPVTEIALPFLPRNLLGKTEGKSWKPSVRVATTEGDIQTERVVISSRLYILIQFVPCRKHITSFLKPLCTDRVKNTVSSNTYIVACVSIAAGTCSPSRCLETNVVSEPFASNGCFSGSTVLAFSQYATIWNTQIESVGGIQRFITLKKVVHIVTTGLYIWYQFVCLSSIDIFSIMCLIGKR
jgi:hypothetical protein